MSPLGLILLPSTLCAKNVHPLYAGINSINAFAVFFLYFSTFSVFMIKGPVPLFVSDIFMCPFISLN